MTLLRSVATGSPGHRAPGFWVLLVMASAVASPAAGQTKGPPKLPDDLALKVTQQEELIDAVLDGTEEVDEAQFRELVQVAGTIVRVRRNHQGERWWETIDAEWRLKDLQRWLSLDDRQRVALKDATALSRQVVELYNQGRYAEAIGLARRESNTRAQLFGREQAERSLKPIEIEL